MIASTFFLCSYFSFIALLTMRPAGAISLDEMSKKSNETSIDSSGSLEQKFRKIHKMTEDEVHSYALAQWKYNTNVSVETIKNAMNASVNLFLFQKLLLSMAKNMSTAFGLNYEDLLHNVSFLSSPGICQLDLANYKKLIMLKIHLINALIDGKVCKYLRTNRSCDINFTDIKEIMISSSDPAELKYYWKAWHNYTSYDIKNQYLKFIGHLNNIAKLNNVSDVVAYNAKNYHTECPMNVYRIYENIKPLYLQLYTYVRKLLRNKFGSNNVTDKGPIPVHLLGSVLGQPWTNLMYSMPDEFAPDIHYTMDIKTPKRLFDQANGFYSSIGMGNLPKSVWARSLFNKSDEFVDCQPSSWDIYKDNDFRIKICSKGGAEDVYKFHTQIGLVHYFMAYKKQPIMHQRPADTVFSESLINALVLSVRYQDFIDRHSDSVDSRRKFLLQMALKKVSILPFAYASDLWHTGVFKGSFAPKHMNDFWWSNRLKYEGVSSPIAKGKDKSANSNYKPFDPSASYSVLTELPRIKYFLQPIIEFQIFKALCIACGEYDPKHADTKPLYECNLRGYKKIAKLIKPVMSKGASVKWQSLLNTIVGYSRLDVNPMLEYFRTIYDHLWSVNNQTNEFLGWKTNAV